MRLTNVVYQANLNVQIDLKCLVHQLNNGRYNPHTFSGLIYQNRKIGGNCLIFSNGKINCNGACSDFDSGVCIALVFIVRRCVRVRRHRAARTAMDDISETEFSQFQFQSVKLD